MFRHFRKFIDNKRRHAEITKYLSVDSSSILNNDCLDFRCGKEERCYVSIGARDIIHSKFTFETASGKVQIGNNTHIGGAHFICRTEIHIGNDVTMAWGITVYDHDSHSVDWAYRNNDNHQYYNDYIKTGNGIIHKDWSHVNSAPIVIEDKVWIGFDVLILKGVTIGEGAVIAAKSVVTKDVPPYTLAAGNPARVVKQL